MLPVLVVTGPPGVGKSAVTEEIYDQLAARDIPHAAVDLDALCLSYPFPAGDSFNDEVALTNLRDVWRNYESNGAQRLVLNRVVETRDYLDRIREALPDPEFVVCRLAASRDTLHRRLRQRETGSSLDSLLKRAEYLSTWFDDSDVADHVFPTDGVKLPELACAILTRIGWIDASGALTQG
ncbi:hypothetical protein ACIBHY_04875 [Nonomuraea sp. NPDC050547]|uniref:hypothetical protein n=1 Tax=unclassified Nonomuraea TaxID=2593643 RepID=UPI0037AEC0B6